MFVSSFFSRRGVLACVLVCCAVLGVAAVACASAFAARKYIPGVSFGSEGSGNGQFTEPVGVAVAESGSGDVYVVDKGNHRVEWFSRAGVYEGQFDGSGAFPNENGV